MSGLTLTEVDDATIPTPAAGKATLFLDDTLGFATKDDAAVVASLQGAAGADAPALTYQNHGNTGATETVNASTANVHRLVADSATVTLTLSGAPASGTVGIVQLYLEQDGTGGRDWVFPGSVVWGAVGEPEWTTRAASAIDLVTLETVDGGTTWAASLAGAAGLVGGGVAIPYVFSTTTADADPGAGNLRLDNATQNTAVAIRADLVGSDGATYTTVIDSLDDSTATVAGYIRLVRTNAPSKFLLFTVASVDASSGYRNITVACVASSSASPFANGDAITLTFTRTGDDGGAGGAPSDATYVTTASNGTLSAEKVIARLADYHPDNYPSSGTTWTDEFEDSSLHADWSWDTAPGGTVSETTFPGFLYLTGGTDNAGTVRLLRRAFVPGASTAFSLAAKVSLAVENGNYNTQIGISVVDSSDVNIWQLIIAGDGTATASDGYRVISTASTWITAATVPLITAPKYLLMTRSAADVYKAFVSDTGMPGNWQYVGTSTVSSTVAKVCVRYGIDTDALDDDASVDFVRVYTTDISATKKIGA